MVIGYEKLYIQYFKNPELLKKWLFDSWNSKEPCSQAKKKVVGFNLCGIVFCTGNCKEYRR